MGHFIHLFLLPMYFLSRFLWKIIWHSVYFFLKRPKRMIYLVVGVLATIGIISKSPTPSQNTYQQTTVETSTTHQVQTTNLQVSELPTIEGTIEDGNSQFTKPLLSLMKKEDRQYYAIAFTAAMESETPQVHYLWQSPPGHLFGKLQASEKYMTSGQTLCRSFQELTSYNKQAQRFHGIACRRKDGRGWCRLRSNSTPSCELEYGGPGIMEQMRALKRKWF